MSKSGKIDIIMEYFEGMDLKDYLIKSNYKVDSSKIKLITKNILNGLAILHENKIIHRDLKPENILVNEDISCIKITDFGICTKVKESETFKHRTTIGTPWYMAPEIILEKPYSYEVDIWSLGCMVFEMVSGNKPFGDMNQVNVMVKMTEYSNPLEYCKENVKDIFYDKSNRDLLDFLQKCWRPNNMFRPSAKDLINHKFLHL